MTALDKMFSISIEIIVEPDGNEYHAYCPALKGLHTCGDTKEKALANAQDAAIAYTGSLLKHGEPLPTGHSSYGVVARRKANANEQVHNRNRCN